MYTDPIIVNPEKPGRPYISFYLNGIRQRIYSGRVLGLPIYPNKAKNSADRLSSLQALKTTLISALDTDSFPFLPSRNSEPDLQLMRGVINQLRMEAKVANTLNLQQLAKLEHIHNLLADYLRGTTATSDK